jgi:hypothetical protein
MNKYLLLLFFVFISNVSFCQSSSLSFISHTSPRLQGFTEAQIDSLISKAPLENFRLQDKHTTLKFDNGFEIELLSANEIAHMGFIITPASYQKDYPEHYHLPSMHLLPNGHMMAAYADDHKKYKGK